MEQPIDVIRRIIGLLIALPLIVIGYAIFSFGYNFNIGYHFYNNLIVFMAPIIQLLTGLTIYWIFKMLQRDYAWGIFWGSVFSTALGVLLLISVM